MSAQVTEAHRELARTIRLHLTLGQAYQLIADSEARAVAEIAMVAAASADRNVSLRLERDQLRAECLNLRADLDAIKAIRNEETARAERAEAEVVALKAQRGQSDYYAAALSAEAELATAKAIIASIEEDGTEEHNAAVRLRRELATERAIVSRIWVQLGSPTYEQLKGRSIYDLIDEIRAELAAERARLDYVMRVCHATNREAIDAAIKEETK